MNVKLIRDDPYAAVICRYFSMQFPRIINASDSQLLEILTTIMVGDKNIRYGPVPPPEQLVVIRKIIAHSIELGLPIPVLVPWGGRKLDKAISLDVAEVSALNQLITVNESVRKYYNPGLQINVRIEDLNAEWLYKDHEGIDDYTLGMVNLITILKGENNITPMLESQMMSNEKYVEVSVRYADLLTDVIVKQMASPEVDVTTLPSFQKLLQAGWQGKIPSEQRNYYIDRYKVMEPGKDNLYYAAKLADYFAGSKARYDLNGRGNPTSKVEGFIQINFANAVPGAPVSIFNNTLYYRTVPMKDGRTHIAPWRAKGYLEIGTDNLIKTKVTNWGNKELIDSLQPVTLQFADSEEKILIQADYTCEDFVPPLII